MPKDKKNKTPNPEETQTTAQTEETSPAEPQEVPRGNRGELGVATAGDTIKQMWHDTHHVLQDVGDKHNPRKQLWVKRAGAPSLKKYAKALAASGNDIAKKWFSNKGGDSNAKRSDANLARAATEASASKAARRKKSQGKANKAATDAAAPAAVATAAVTAKGKKG
jgi:hypothetical protein